MTTIYVLDDDPDITKMVAFRLKKENFDVMTFEQCQKALDAVKDAPPDALILDFHMPDLNGLEVYNELERLGYSEKFPIVVLSGTTEIEKKGFPKKTNLILMTKPCDFKELFSSIRNQLENHPAA